MPFVDTVRVTIRVERHDDSRPLLDSECYTAETQVRLEVPADDGDPLRTWISRACTSAGEATIRRVAIAEAEYLTGIGQDRPSAPDVVRVDE